MGPVILAAWVAENCSINSNNDCAKALVHSTIVDLQISAPHLAPRFFSSSNPQTNLSLPCLQSAVYCIVEDFNGVRHTYNLNTTGPQLHCACIQCQASPDHSRI